MKRLLCAAAASALVLTACSTPRSRMFSEAEPRMQGYTSALVSQPNPTAPNVFVTPDNRFVLVDQEPIYPPPGDQVVIYFGLEQNGAYEFLPNNGVEFQGHPDFCAPLGQFVVKCSFRRGPSGTKYTYTVRVRPVGGGATLQSDPTVMN